MNKIQKTIYYTMMLLPTAQIVSSQSRLISTVENIRERITENNTPSWWRKIDNKYLSFTQDAEILDIVDLIGDENGSIPHNIEIESAKILSEVNGEYRYFSDVTFNGTNGLQNLRLSFEEIRNSQTQALSNIKLRSHLLGTPQMNGRFSVPLAVFYKEDGVSKMFSDHFSIIIQNAEPKVTNTIPKNKFDTLTPGEVYILSMNLNGSYKNQLEIHGLYDADGTPAIIQSTKEKSGTNSLLFRYTPISTTQSKIEIIDPKTNQPNRIAFLPNNLNKRGDAPSFFARGFAWDNEGVHKLVKTWNVEAPATSRVMLEDNTNSDQRVVAIPENIRNFLAQINGELTVKINDASGLRNTQVVLSKDNRSFTVDTKDVYAGEWRNAINLMSSNLSLLEVDIRRKLRVQPRRYAPDTNKIEIELNAANNSIVKVEYTVLDAHGVPKTTENTFVVNGGKVTLVNQTSEAVFRPESNVRIILDDKTYNGPSIDLVNHTSITIGSGECFAVINTYPNPGDNANVIITRDNPRVIVNKAEVYNIAGQRVQTLFNNPINQDSITKNINLNGFANGMYFLQVELQCNETVVKSTRKITKM